MQATAEGTARYTARYPDFREAAFCRTVFDLQVSSLGLGTYLGAPDEAGSQIDRSRANMGVATWDGFRQKGSLNLERIAALAAAEGGAGHHFRFVQLPFNLAMVEAYVDKPESVLEADERLRIAVVASASLVQAQVLHHMPDAVQERLPGLADNAQRAIQFTRSTPGISVALVGMGGRQHVLKNLGVARVPPVTREAYQRLCR